MAETKDDCMGEIRGEAEEDVDRPTYEKPMC